MKRLSVICLVVILWIPSANAAGSGGIESPFAFGAGARELALGGAALTRANDATTVFWNPSNMTLAQRISITGMHSELLINGAVYQYFGVVVPTLDLGGFGVGLFRQSIQHIDKRDDNNMYLGEFEDSHLRLYLGYGRRLGQFVIGTSLSVDHQSIDTYRATSSPGLTLAASHCRNLKPSWLTDLTVSAVIRSLLKPGIRLVDETYQYPTVVELSGSVRISTSLELDHVIEPFVTLRKVESIPIQLYAGLEYTYKQILQLRTGFRQKNFSFGAGINLSLVSFDYTLVDRDLDFIHLFSLTGSFGQSVDERLKTRAEKREADFRQAMSHQMQQRNLSLIDELLTTGHSQLASGQYDEAMGSFDRLIFLARSTGLDEGKYEKLLDSAIDLSSAAETTSLLQAAVDSASARFASGDLLTARYLASRALEVDSSCDRARRLFNFADDALRSETERTEFLSEQLTRADSLIDSHQFDQAQLIVESLNEIAPGDDAIMRRINRLELEKLRRKIADIESQRYDSSAYTTTMPATESATIDSAKAAAATAPAKVKPVSKQRQAELHRMYQDAKQLFNDGDIRAAVERWETVAAEAPDFQSVKEFLIKAYKFLGLELYGQKQRSQAITVWRKSLALDPENIDIAEYIKRAESQIKKLEELAHEQL